MDINETIETTRVVTATVSLDDIRNVAINAVKLKAGISPTDDVISAEADADASGSVLVKIAVRHARQAADSQQVPQQPTSTAPAPIQAIADAGLIIPSAPAAPV